MDEALSRDPIQLFVPFFRTQECLDEMAECLEMGWTGLGYKTVEFEQAWADYTGLPYALFVNSATAALHLALEVLRTQCGWQSEDEVITTPLTFVSTNHTILQTGMKPVFADTDEYLCLSPESIRERITSRTRAVMFVGLGGNVGRLAEVREICDQFSLKLILDGAHMAGTKLNGQDPGQFADVSCYSFQAVKNMPTADSGAVCFSEEVQDMLARKLSWLGISKDTYARTNRGTYSWMYDVDDVGFKYNGNSLMAAIALVSLRYLNDDNKARRSLSEAYSAALRGRHYLDEVPVAPDCVPSRHLYQVRVENRALAMQVMNEHSIFPGVHYRDNTEYPMYAYGRGTCPGAARASQEVLSLPLHLRLGNEEIARVVAALDDYADRLT